MTHIDDQGRVVVDVTRADGTHADVQMIGPHFYRPTQGVDVGCWNVFPRHGGPSRFNVPFECLPIEVQAYVRDAVI